MHIGRCASVGSYGVRAKGISARKLAHFSARVATAASFFSVALTVSLASAQVNVLTAHNDIGRTGQNLNETILTPANVNTTQFGKLFTQPVDGLVFAQPLYVFQVAIPGKGTHNVAYVVTSSDFVYAFDADTNGGVSSSPLWQTSLATSGLHFQYGVYGTPVIDLSSNTMYLVSSEYQGSSTNYIFRLHALDITTGAEKLGGPVLIQGSVPGNGSGSNGGVLAFDPYYHQQRPGLLLLNGVLYIAFGSTGDNGVWHGWIFSYSEKTLQQINIYCTTPNGSGGGIWMGGAALAAEVNAPSKPYGRMFVATGNGSYSASTPYNNTMNYGMSVLDLDLTGGVMTVTDEFTPYDEATLDGQDGDLGSGNPVLLPTQTLASGATLSPLVEIGKSGMIYILNRNNLGGFNATTDQVVQEVQTPIGGGHNWGAGVWGTEAYWNNTIYSGGTNPGLVSYSGGAGNGFTSYSFAKGVLSTAPTGSSVQQFSYAGPTPSISANGATNGIVWVIKTDALDSLGPEALIAFNAANIGQTLYSSNDNLTRDSPGEYVEYVVPTIANGKVYVGAYDVFSVYGLLANTTAAPAPVISPGSGAFTGTKSVTISDALAGATIYYTTNDQTPTTSSAVYGNTPITVTTNETITAIASAAGYLQSAPSSATYVSTTTTANPVFSLAGGTYIGAQTLTITDGFSGAVVYYTLDGSTPTAASAVYAQPLIIPVTETVNAIAVAPNLSPSAVTSATYTIQPDYTINFSNGFAVAQGPMTFNGSTDLDDVRLQLTNGEANEAGSAFYATPVGIQSFTTDFTFQLSNPAGDGMTFTIQNVGPTALGSIGGGLGYATIPKSLAIKFDLFNNSGEGVNSTGMYLNGATPTVPAVSLVGTAINLHSGDFIEAHITYDGANLTLSLTDAETLGTWSQSVAVNIPAVVGANTAYVGFTGGTGASTASQKVLSWTYTAGPPVPNFPSGFTTANLSLNGVNGPATLSGTRLRLTDGQIYEARSAFFTTPVSVQEFTTSFQFQETAATADGFTFTLQGNSPGAVGAWGGGLGYTGMPASLAIAFDVLGNSGQGPNTTAMYVNGTVRTVPTTNLSAAGINLSSGHIFNVQLTYNGTTLTVVTTDTATNASATQVYTIDIPAIIGGLTAYAGFTGGTGGATAIQDILNWSYTPNGVAGPAFPAGFASPSLLDLNGGAGINGTRLRLTDDQLYEARSTFFTVPVSDERFTSTFQFQITDPVADGFTFTIQNDAATAVGADGGGLGYTGLAHSVAIAFDMYGNSSQGANTTALYVNGVAKTVPAANLSSGGINLFSGHIFNVQLTYDGSTLTEVVTDTVTNATVTESYSLNIPALIGETVAFVGFTAGSGAGGAIQDILSWNYIGEN
jgi:hypothetical protein